MDAPPPFAIASLSHFMHIVNAPVPVCPCDRTHFAAQCVHIASPPPPPINTAGGGGSTAPIPRLSDWAKFFSGSSGPGGGGGAGTPLPLKRALALAILLAVRTEHVLMARGGGRQDRTLYTDSPPPPPC